MHYLVIDTCVWIDLCKNFTDVGDKICELIEQEKVRLILPQIVVDEWNRHKDSKVIDPKQSAISNQIKQARKISHHLRGREAEEFKRILDKFRERRDEVESLILQDVSAVENLFNHPSTIKPPITENVKSQAVEFALAKKAPFGNKNSMADALILFSSISYVKGDSLTNCIFVSSNTRDFSSPNTPQIHEDLKDMFDELGISYFISIGQAINEIETNLISDERIREIEETLQFEALQGFLENYQQTVGSLNLMSDLSAIGEAATGQREMMERLSESVMSIGGMTVFHEAMASSRRAMDGIDMDLITGELSAVSEAMTGQREMMESLGESIRAIGGMTALHEAIAQCREMNRVCFIPVKVAKQR